MDLHNLTIDEMIEIEMALRPVLDKLKRERGIYGTSTPLPGMARRVKVKGVPIASVRYHENMTDRRVETIESVLSKISADIAAAEIIAATA